VIARLNNAAQDVAQFRLIIDQPQQCFAASAPCTDAENIFRGRIEADDQQVRIKQNDARAKAIENLFCVVVECSVVAGTPVKLVPV